MTEEKIEVAGENNPEPGVVGMAEENELNTLIAINRSLQQNVMRIGNLEVQKQETFYHMQALQEQAEMVTRNIGQRLGLPEGVRLTVTQDGKVREVPTNKA